MTLGEAEGDSGEAATCLDGEKDEKEILRQAIALSEKNEKEDDEDEILKQAIALSLED